MPSNTGLNKSSQFGPTYSLYGIVSHTGFGPHHGHYVAHVKSAAGRWYEMNDEDVSRSPNSPPLGMKEAYILFYIQDGESRLNDAIGLNRPRQRVKRQPSVEDDEEEKEEEGPPRPDDLPSLNLKPIGGPEVALRAAEANANTKFGRGISEKIEELRQKQEAEKVTASDVDPKPLSTRGQPVSLVKYGDGDDEEEDVGEKVVSPGTTDAPERIIGPQLPSTFKEPEAYSQSSNPRPSEKSALLGSISGTLDAPIAPVSFYGGPGTLPSMAHRRRGSSPGTTETEESSDSSRKDRKRSHNGAGWGRDHADRRKSGLSSNSLSAPLGGNPLFTPRSKPQGGIKNKMKGRP